jgi:hypothetical protein
LRRPKRRYSSSRAHALAAFMPGKAGPDRAELTSCSEPFKVRTGRLQVGTEETHGTGLSHFQRWHPNKKSPASETAAASEPVAAVSFLQGPDGLRRLTPQPRFIAACVVKHVGSSLESCRKHFAIVRDFDHGARARRADVESGLDRRSVDYLLRSSQELCDDHWQGASTADWVRGQAGLHRAGTAKSPQQGLLVDE